MAPEVTRFRHCLVGSATPGAIAGREARAILALLHNGRMA